jgi:hypothetical protein
MLPSLTRRMRSWVHCSALPSRRPCSDCAVVLRAEFHCDGDIVGSDCDGGLYRYSPSGLGASPDDAGICHYPGGNRDHLVWRSWDNKLLILSQVVLGIALPFSIIPLMMFTADQRKMGALAPPIWVTLLTTLTPALLIAQNFKGLYLSTRLQPDGIKRSCGKKRPL